MMSTRSPHHSRPPRPLQQTVRTIRSSLFALLGGQPDDTPVARHRQLETIRAHMTDSLGSRVDEYAGLARRIRLAPDIQSLWFLRGELMGMLAAEYGETEAGKKMTGLSRLFDGLIPRGLKARPSPLGK